jgi:uncharacterized protein YdiU (UPF0061 family)
LTIEQDSDVALSQDLLDRMAANKADFTLTFRELCDAAASREADEAVRSLFENPAAYDEWAVRWRFRLDQEPQDGAQRQAAMRRANPCFIPRNHRVEAVIEAGVTRHDFAPFNELMTVLSAPYEEQPAFATYAAPPPPNQRVYRTFCGT